MNLRRDEPCLAIRHGWPASLATLPIRLESGDMLLRNARRLAPALTLSRGFKHGGGIFSGKCARMQPRREASLLTRPPHQQPVSTWHLTNTREASGPLAKDQVKRFFDDGFVCLPNFYSKEQIETVQVCQKQNFAFVLASSSPTACPLSGLSSVSLAAAHVCKRDVEGQLDRLASRLFASGLVKDRYSGQDWTQRLLSLRQDCSDAPIMLIKEGVLPRGLADLYSDPLVLDAAAQLGVGPDICLNPAWNLRGKMPNYANTVIPWHQVSHN